MIKPQIPTGFWELDPQRQKQFKKLLQIIESIYEASHFNSIETPTMEYKEILLAKSQGETSKQIFQLAKGSKEYVLKYDNTVPLSRYVAQHYNEICFPFKAYQVAKVYRAEKPQQGRYREFYQADIDIVGNEKLSLANDAFVIKTIASVLKEVGLLGYRIHINNRKIMEGLVEYFDIKEVQQEVFSIIDKYDKLTNLQIESELGKYIEENLITKIMELLELEDEAVIEYLKTIAPYSKVLEEGIIELEQVLEIVRYLEVPKTNYNINLKIIRGLDYYTGTVFETTIEGFENMGSIASGGSYQNLASTFINKCLPGVGASIGVSRLFVCLEQAGLLDNLIEQEDSYLIVPISIGLSYPIEILQWVESKGLNAAVYLEDTKIAKVIKYAKQLNVNKLIFIGSQEVESRTLKFKDLETYKEENVKFEELDSFINK